MTDDPTAADLDRRLRQAAEALLALAGPERHQALAARIDDELARLDAPRALEPSMTTDTDDDAAPTSIVPPTRNEDSGLHDIKALAKDTRRRISRRITSQHDVDESLLSASHSGLRAVALPEPAMVVAFPEAPASLAEVKPASPAAVAAIEAAGPPPARKRTALWLGGGAVALAAAAAVAVVAGGGGSSDKKHASDQVAAAPSKAPAVGAAEPTPAMDPTMIAATAPAAAPAVDTVAAAPGAAMEEAGGDKFAAPPPPATTGRTEDDRADKRVEPARAKPEDRVATKPSDKPAGDAKTAKPDGKTKDATGTGAAATKPAGGGATGGATAGGGGGEKSIEDLLNDASGGGKPKDSPTAPTGPVKSGLEPKEIKAGMSAVAGAAQACYGKHGESGHVKIKAVVAPSGAVSKVDATGEFAGTPTGACVAAAVKGASFPSWTGAPMTVTYSFTLQE